MNGISDWSHQHRNVEQKNFDGDHISQQYWYNIINLLIKTNGNKWRINTIYIYIYHDRVDYLCCVALCFMVDPHVAVLLLVIHEYLHTITSKCDLEFLFFFSLRVIDKNTYIEHYSTYVMSSNAYVHIYMWIFVPWLPNVANAIAMYNNLIQLHTICMIIYRTYVLYIYANVCWHKIKCESTSANGIWSEKKSFHGAYIRVHTEWLNRLRMEE